MVDSSILLKQFDGSNYSQYFPQNLPPDIANQFVNLQGKNSNDIFNYLGKYCQYWWKKYFEGQVIEYSENKSHIEQDTLIFNFASDNTYDIPSDFIIKHSKNIIINENGVSLKDAQTTTITFSKSDYPWIDECVSSIQKFLNDNKPCYCSFLDNKVYYLPSNSTVNSYNPQTIDVKYTDGDYTKSYDIYLQYTKFTSGYTPNPAELVSYTTNTYNKTEIQYVNSTNQSQYPDGKKIDNWLYTYLGIPLENIVEKTQFACGTYVGTGASGSSSPNALQFSFSPKIIFIIGDNQNAGFGIYNGSIYSLYDTSGLSETTWNNKSISWFTKDSYSNNVRPKIQFNVSGRNYYYLVLG